MSKTIVLTGVGRDRTGIVSQVAELLYNSGCNLLDSSMTLLRGEFAIILMFELPEGESLTTLQKQCKALEEKTGLTIHLRQMADDELIQAEAAGTAFMISVYGADKAGIVFGVTKVLAELGINITDVQTKYTYAGNTFVMLLEVTVPPTVPESTLKATLDKASRDLQVDISFQALDVYEL